MRNVATDHARAATDEIFSTAIHPAAITAIIARYITAAVESETAELRALLDLLTPADPCRFDHHGNCQEHGWFNLHADSPCPVGEAQKLLGKAKP